MRVVNTYVGLVLVVVLQLLLLVVFEVLSPLLFGHVEHLVFHDMSVKLLFLVFLALLLLLLGLFLVADVLIHESFDAFSFLDCFNLLVFLKFLQRSVKIFEPYLVVLGQDVSLGWVVALLGYFCGLALNFRPLSIKLSPVLVSNGRSLLESRHFGFLLYGGFRVKKALNFSLVLKKSTPRVVIALDRVLANQALAQRNV